uniref:Uncharacterized protein n=1 Tax=Nothobranchius furzeri TaxID=105023 RepID=A0A1A8AXT1_NOTFU
MKRTGENVAARLTQAADAYHIPPALRVSVVANKAANMVLSVELLKGSGWGHPVELRRFMLERPLEQRWPITAVLSDPNYTGRNDSSTLDKTTEQWNVAEDITDVLNYTDRAVVGGDEHIPVCDLPNA